MVQSLWLLPLLFVGQAHAGKKAPPLHRCEVTATAHTGASVTLAGWGASPQEARLAADRVGRFWLDHHLQRQVWEDILYGGDSSRPVLLDGAVSETLRIPGAVLTEGSCAELRLPKVQADVGWKATWPEGASESLLRSVPAASLEAARRRACTQPYQDALMQAFEATARAAPEDWLGLVQSAWEQASSDLTRCLSVSEAPLEPLKGLEPRSDEGPARCERIGFVRNEPIVVGSGWGSSWDMAAEAAAGDALYTDTRRALGDGLRAVAQASPETKMTLVASALADAIGMTGPSDAFERAWTFCHAASERTPLTWTPTRPPWVDSCGDQMPLVSDDLDAHPESARDALCGAHAADSIAMLREAATRAGPQMKDTILASGWSIAAGCEAHCLADTLPATEPQTMASLAPSPDRSTPDAAWALFEAAMRDQDFASLTLVLPMMADADSLRRMGGAQAFFAAAEQAVAEGQLAQMKAMFSFEQVHGVYYLGQPRRR